MAVSVAEILEALKAASIPVDVEGFTSHDLGKALGVGRHRAQEINRSLIDAGKVEFVGKRRVTRADQSPGLMPVYRMVQ